MQLEALTAELIQGGYANSTLVYYKAWWAKLVKFLTDHNLSEQLPINSHHIALFLADLFKAGKKEGALRSILSAIAFKHKLEGKEDPTKAFIIKRLLTGARKAKGNPPRKLALNINILMKLILILPHVVSNTYYYKLYKSLFLLMYFACLRVGEVVHSNHGNHCLHLDAIFLSSLTPKADMIIVLNSYKHSKKPAKFLLPQGKDTRFCPKKALLEFLIARQSAPGPLFVGQKGEHLSRYLVQKTLKKSLTRIGCDATRFNTHSFRVGRASDLATQGVSEQIIRETGRWNSNAFMKYLRFELFHLS